VGELRATVTGATGLLGSRLLPRLLDNGVEVTVLSRDPESARARLAPPAREVEILRWDPLAEPAPTHALQGRDAVVHLCGENVAQRWSARAKRAIRDSRIVSTRNLIAGFAQADTRPRALLCASAVGYYGAAGEEPLDEDSPAGAGFLAGVCAEWEREAQRASELGARVVSVRIGIVLDGSGGALERMLTPFRLGLGGPIAGGRHYMPWVHQEDLVGIISAALADERFSGPVNATAPEPVTNAEFSRTLGRVLRRPAFVPLPAFALRAMFGEMSSLLTAGARVMPAKALVLGYAFAHPQLDGALRAAVAGE
jgi:uncharacterized protein (TIGR01777 family)